MQKPKPNGSQPSSRTESVMAGKQAKWGSAKADPLLAYVADLELEVDRLRKQGQFVQQHVRTALKRIQGLGTDKLEAKENVRRLADIDETAKQLGEVLRDLQEAPGYHPAHDQVIAIAVRPMAEQVFRWQQRLLGADDVTLRLDLGSDYVDWFPARLRHILDNLISNSLKYRDPSKGELWVQLTLRVLPEGYEFCVSDNGLGLPPPQQHMLELFYRAAPVRAAGLGVGLAVVKLLVEQSAGKLTMTAGEGQGSTLVAFLPRYDIDDFLT
jgi:signal transduction histidine kinase